VFLLDVARAAERDGYVAKTLLLDLLAAPTTPTTTRNVSPMFPVRSVTYVPGHTK
jgi:hypothetical protein